jgi:hypothetical protein
MSKRITILCVVALVSVTFVVYLRFYQRSSVPNVDGFPYFLSPDEMAGLQVKAQRGDCDAAFRLAKYYLYGALQLDTRTKWLRLAAKCPNAEVKGYLAKILMHNGDDPAAAAEISQTHRGNSGNRSGKGSKVRRRAKGQESVAIDGQFLQFSPGSSAP